MTKIGICALTGTREDVKAIIASAADYVELPCAPMLMPLGHDGFAELVGWLDDLGARVETSNLFLPSAMPLSGPDADVQATKAYIRDALHRMERLGVGIAGFGAGPGRSVPAGYDRAATLDELENVLRFASDEAAEHGIVVALEPLRREETNVFTTLSETERFVRERDLPRLKMMGDYFHIMAEEEPLDHFRSLGDLLVHMHVSDNDRLPPGVGRWDFTELFRQLAAIDYAGRISIEVDWRSLTTQADAATEHLATAMQAAGWESNNVRIG